MPAELIWETASCLCIKYSGTVTGGEILSNQRSITDDYRFDGMRILILDSSRIENNLATEEDIKQISAIAIAQSKTNPFVKNVVILNENEDAQALAAYYQLLSESTGWEIRLFHKEADARKWLEELNQ